MPILFGPFDPMKLIFSILNSLISKRLLTISEARDILRSSLDPNMADVEKDKFVDSLFMK